jgi:hypothetical protein
MRTWQVLKNGFWVAALCVCAQAQAPPAAPPAVPETKGMPPRPSAADYPKHVQTGKVTIAAEFTGHGVGTQQSALLNEEHVVVEVAFFGPPEARAKIAAANFTLRINGKKPLESEPYGVILSSLKDPEWQPPPGEEETKQKGGGLNGAGTNEAPAPPKMTFAERRAMEQKVIKATLPEGDRLLPVAGLIYFPYRGKGTGIKTVELIYDGPAGKATLSLMP